MYQIIPKTELIFKLVFEKKSHEESKKTILLSILKKVFFACFVFIVCFVLLYMQLDQQHIQSPYLLVLNLFILSIFLIIFGAYYTIKKYNSSLELYEFTCKYFDKSIIEIANDFDTRLATYLIDYLGIKSSIFDGESVELRSKDIVNYGETRMEILKHWNSNKSPKIPFGTDASTNYLSLMSHMIQVSRANQTSFRELYKQANHITN